MVDCLYIDVSKLRGLLRIFSRQLLPTYAAGPNACTSTFLWLPGRLISRRRRGADAELDLQACHGVALLRMPSFRPSAVLCSSLLVVRKIAGALQHLDCLPATVGRAPIAKHWPACSLRQLSVQPNNPGACRLRGAL